MSSHKPTGDLTDVGTWERAWQRAPSNTTRGSWLVENHHAVFAPFLAAAGANELSVLEIGCAPGKKLRAMATFAPQHRYAGVDFAPDALERTGDFLRGNGVTAALHLADVRAFHPAQLFDLVVSFGLVEHFEAPVDMVKEHARLAKPGGVVGIQIPNYRHPFVKRALSVYSPVTLETHNLETMTTDALASYLRAAGLEDVTTGSYGGAVMPVAGIKPGRTGKSLRWMFTGWNLLARTIPRRLSPWQVFLWAHGRKPT